MNWSERMKQDWNDRARQDAKHYILCGKTDWNDDEFFRLGERDVATFADPFLARISDLSREVAVDIGCGLGRLTLPLARRFAAAVGVDVSEEMVAKARAKWADHPRVSFVANNGTDLGVLGESTADFVFSYIVLQHIPDPEITYGYLREVGRVLKPSGAYLLQLSNSDVRSHEAYAKRWRERREEFDRSGKITPFEDHRYEYLESKIPNFETLLQQPVDFDRATAALRVNGCTVEHVEGRGTDFLWLGGRKPR